MLHTTLYVTAISVAKSAKADLLQHLYNSSKSTAFEKERIIDIQQCAAVNNAVEI